ncbi:M20-dimer domain-containing protein [Acetobacteraceae bacterium EV16G]
MSQMLAQVLEEIDRTQEASLARLETFLRIPSISTRPEHKADCRRAADHLVADLTSIGFDARTEDTPGHPMIVAHTAAGQHDNAAHVLFYGHYDVQPTDPEDLWRHPPFEPVIENQDGRKVIVARGASDDKGQVMTFIEACRAWKKLTGKLPVSVSFLIEGEEESGGENLLPFMKAHRDELRADIALICDTGMPDRTTPAITTSLRGLLAEEVTVNCARHDLHSGMFGNAARNPAELLSRIIGSLRDASGRVVLDGFYDGVTTPSPEIRAQWKSVFPDDKAILQPLGLTDAAGESDFSAIEQIWARPSFEVNGITSGYTGEGFKTVIPAKATAKISFRLVPGQDPQKIRETFRHHVKSMLPPDAEVQFTSHGGSSGSQLAQAGQFLEKTRAALQDEWGKPALMIGCGGSIPVAGEVKEALDMDALLVGFAQDDDRIHSPNEQYGLEQFHRGIRSWVRILASFAA